VKKLYEKFIGKPIPEDRHGVAINNGENIPNYFVVVPYCPIIITEVRNTNDAPYLNVTTELHIDINDSDVMEAVRRFGNFLVYRKTDYVSQDVVVHEYIESKALKYGVKLDNDLYFKLRNFVESL
jgi:hypothetical protein